MSGAVYLRFRGAARAFCARRGRMLIPPDAGPSASISRAAKGARGSVSSTPTALAR